MAPRNRIDKKQDLEGEDSFVSKETRDQFYGSVDPKGRYVCQKCKVPLVKTPVQLLYLHAGFPVELPACPVCGQVLISEELALGRVLHVEKALEDK